MSYDREIAADLLFQNNDAIEHIKIWCRDINPTCRPPTPTKHKYSVGLFKLGLQYSHTNYAQWRLHYPQSLQIVPDLIYAESQLLLGILTKQLLY